MTKVLCPICNKEGSLQKRGSSCRVGHYQGFQGKTVKVLWHCVTLEDLEKVNMVNTDLKSKIDGRGSIAWYCMTSNQRGSDNARLIIWRTRKGPNRRLVSRSRGLESRPRHQNFKLVHDNE